MKKRLVIIGLLLLVVVGIGVAAVVAFGAQSQTQQVRDAETHYQNALDYYNKREWQSAKFETENALKLNPAHCCAAELQAKVALELDLEKRYADAQDKRSTGNVCAAADDFSWVYARRKTYKQITQNLLESTQCCAQALLAQGNYRDAMSYLRIADDIEVNPNVKALLSKLESYQAAINSIAAQRWDEAIAALQAVYQADANFLLTRDNLCAALVQRGMAGEAKSDWDAARADFDQALKVKGDCANAESHKQQINARLHAQWIEQCQAAKAAKDYAAASALGNKALELNPQSAEARECLKGPEPIFTTVASSLAGLQRRAGTERLVVLDDGQLLRLAADEHL